MTRSCQLFSAKRASRPGTLRHATVGINDLHEALDSTGRHMPAAYLRTQLVSMG